MAVKIRPTLTSATLLLEFNKSVEENEPVSLGNGLIVAWRGRKEFEERNERKKRKKLLLWAWNRANFGSCVQKGQNKLISINIITGSWAQRDWFELKHWNTETETETETNWGCGRVRGKNSIRLSKSISRLSAEKVKAILREEEYQSVLSKDKEERPLQCWSSNKVYINFESQKVQTS